MQAAVLVANLSHTIGGHIHGRSDCVASRRGSLEFDTEPRIVVAIVFDQAVRRVVLAGGLEQVEGTIVVVVGNRDRSMLGTL